MLTTTTLLPADLATITAFEGLPAETLDWLLAHGECRLYAAGETIFEPGAPADYLVGLLRGAMQFYSVRGSQREPGFRIEAGQVSGALPYSRLRVIQGLGLAVGDTQLFLLHRDYFSTLEQVSPELTQRLVSMMSDRVRDQTRTQERDDKLRALGKLSAGLAHELNNPAAAIARAAQSLATHLQAQPALLQDLVAHCPSPGALAALTALAVPGAPISQAFSALECADYEDELADWLESQGVKQGFKLAAGMLEAGLTPERLQPLANTLPAAGRPAAFAWLEGQLTSLRLIQDVQEAGGRISKLVSDVKTYSHMDRDSGRELLELAPGLDSTLNMLGFQLRAKNIRVVRDYAPDLPKIQGQVGSLNQVWTNLLDNAISVLPEGGQITLRTRREGSFARVFLIDNGPGIPTDVLPHIFEPFYTTKPAGEGSGLGLDIAQRIIRQHDGRLEVSSVPGHTEFCAWLPLPGALA
ncbi:ATP-binding protein [Hymenobacter saemangeumensis]|uniref:histidine kinase n=1 Tax=Hymenobacter saemangeumensis TaxID=1084522 RepID=A0ABP8I4D0_9BACT